MQGGKTLLPLLPLYSFMHRYILLFSFLPLRLLSSAHDHLRGHTILHTCIPTGVPDIEMIVRKMQLRWAGHVARMSDNRIPKQLLFGELTIGTRTVGRPLLRWKDSLKDTLKQSNISTTHWQDTATDRSAWRRSIHDGLVLYDDSRRERNATKRARRHAARNATSSASQDAYMCRHCGRTCSSHIGILSHERACNKQKRT